MAQFGIAKTGPFLIGEAAIMLGPQASLFDMTIANHGVGLTKNLQFQETPAFTDLTQGTTNQVVDTTKTGSQATFSFEAYEYTAKNLAYASGLDGSAFTTNTVATTASAGVTGDGSVAALSVTSASGLSIGDYIAIDIGGEAIIRKISNLVTNTITVDKPFATGQNVASGADVHLTHFSLGGGAAAVPFLSMKAEVKTSDGGIIVLYVPKVRVTKGLNLATGSSDYSNMPFELEAVALLSADPFSADFGDKLFGYSVR